MSWQRALAGASIDTDAARLHRRIGMAGELLMEASAREAGRKMSRDMLKAAGKRHAGLFARLEPKPRPVEGTVLLLQKLRQSRINFGGCLKDMAPTVPLP